MYSSDSSKEPAKDLIRKEITPQIRKSLQKLAPALITEHGKDIQHAPGSNPGSGVNTPKVLQSSSATKPGDGSKTSSTTSTKGKINVTSLSDQQEFRTTAEQLFETFTDPQRIAAFTRAPPKVFEGAKEGARFEIFGGNVSGSFSKLEKPTYIEQKWRLAQWPAEHFSTLKIKFEQNDVDAVTIMRVDWEGVPVGQGKYWLLMYVCNEVILTAMQKSPQSGIGTSTTYGASRPRSASERYYRFGCMLAAWVYLV